MAIPVSEDVVRLKQAAIELLEESRTFDDRARLRKLAESAMPEQRQKMLADAEPERALAWPYYARALYLLRLDARAQTGLLFSRLFADEVVGLAAIRAARAEHEAQHPPCPACGAGLERPGAFSCRCGWKNSTKGRAA